MQNFGVVGRLKEFLLFLFDFVKNLILRDDIVIFSEEEVFEIILEWIDENFMEREQYFVELFFYV